MRKEMKAVNKDPRSWAPSIWEPPRLSSAGLAKALCRKEFGLDQSPASQLDLVLSNVFLKKYLLVRVEYLSFYII